MKSIPSLQSRRGFLSTTAKAGLLLGVPGILNAASGSAPSSRLNVAMVGFGRWGRNLFGNLRNIPGIHVQAVCDIWDRARAVGQGRSRQVYGMLPNGYGDIDEMLEHEIGLDAAIIATPDFWHAPHAVRCMEAGLHVYCESVMAETIDAAREIVRASDRTGMLCQIGHQHRSSPVYRYSRDMLVREHRICGPVHNINSQWNISVNDYQDIGVNPRLVPKAEILQRYGYRDIHEFMNWMLYPAKSIGTLGRFTARQLDLIHGFIEAVPESLTVFAGRDVFQRRECFDNLMCVMQYETPHGKLRAFHQSLTSMNDPEIRFEKLIGTDATLRIGGAGELTEIRNRTSGDDSGEHLRKLAARGIIRESRRMPCYLQQENEDAEMGLLSHASTPPIPYEIPGRSIRPAVELHLVNFFDSIRGRAQLNCDARSAFAGEAAAYFLHAAGETGETLRFGAEEFAV